MNKVQKFEPPDSPTVPSWVRYLVAAFPSATVSPQTFAVFQDRFSEFSSEDMIEGVRRLVDSWVWAHRFPTVADLRRHVLEGRDALPPLDFEGRRELHSRRMDRVRELFVTWDPCPSCGEDSPSPGPDCPFCRDLERMTSVNQ